MRRTHRLPEACESQVSNLSSSFAVGDGTDVSKPPHFQVDNLDRVVSDEIVPSQSPDDVLKSLVIPLQQGVHANHHGTDQLSLRQG